MPVTENGRVWLTNGDKFYSVPEEQAPAALAQLGNARFASAQEVADRQRIREHEGGAGQAKIAGKNFVAGAFDAATALIRVPAEGAAMLAGDDKALKEIQQLTGHKLQENLAYIGAELTGGSGPKAAREFAEATRTQAEANPTTATLAESAGGIAGGFALEGALAKGGGMLAGKLGGGFGARMLGRLAEGGVAGAMMGETSVHTYDYLAGDSATREKLLAGAGMGALLGAGLSGTFGLAGEGVDLAKRRAQEKAAAVFGKASKPVRDAGEAAADEALEKTAAEQLGTKPVNRFGERLREWYETAQAAVTGVDKETVKKLSPLRWGDENLKAREILFNRDAIMQGAEKELVGGVDNLVTKSREVFDEVVDSSLKRSHVDALLDPKRAIEQVESARAELFGVRKTLGELAADADTYGNRALLERTDKFISKLQKTVSHTDTTASEAFIALDQAKRALQKQRVSLGRSAARQPDALLQSQAHAAGRALESIQERTRQNLMSDLWGEAGGAQREINAAWEQWFESKKLFDSSALRRVGEEFDGRAIVAADPEKLSRFLNKVGRQESELVRKHFSNYVDASERLAKAIDAAHDLGPKAKTVLEVAESAKRVRETLAKAQETLGFANQADALLNHNNAALGTAATLSGALLGGGPGAALGAILGAVSSPGRSLQTAWGVQRLLGRVDDTIKAQVVDALGGLGKVKAGARKAAAAAEKTEIAAALPGTKRAVAEAQTLGLEEATGLTIENSDAAQFTRRALLRGAIQTFKEPGEDEQAAYVKRRDQLAELVTNPTKLVDAVTAAVSPLAETQPVLAGALAGDMTAALYTLQGMAPSEPSLGAFTSDDKRFIPEADLRRFAQQWEGVTSPLSILEDLKEGTLTPEKRDAVKLAYPALFEHIQGVALSMITQMGNGIPTEVRTQFDLLLELDGQGEPSVSPSFLANMQRIAESKNQAQAPRPPAPGSKMRVADKSRTLTESATSGV